MPRTASVMGVGPQTYADGKLKNSIASRVQSARCTRPPAAGGEQQPGTGRCQSARNAAGGPRKRSGRYDGLVPRADIKLGARMVTDQLIERWSKRLW